MEPLLLLCLLLHLCQWPLAIVLPWLVAVVLEEEVEVPPLQHHPRLQLLRPTSTNQHHLVLPQLAYPNLHLLRSNSNNKRHLVVLLLSLSTPTTNTTLTRHPRQRLQLLVVVLLELARQLLQLLSLPQG